MDPMLFTDDWKEFLRLANSHRLKYLVVGGVAVSLHGHTRSTHDIDIWIENSVANINRLKKTMTSFGFLEQAESVPNKMGNRDVLFLGKTPFRIDILSGISGLTFARVFRSKQDFDVDGILVPVIDLENLIINKEASGRHKDLADVEVLRQIRFTDE
jgi:hypothetical protein